LPQSSIDEGLTKILTFPISLARTLALNLPFCLNWRPIVAVSAMVNQLPAVSANVSRTCFYRLVPLFDHPLRFLCSHRRFQAASEASHQSQLPTANEMYSSLEILASPLKALYVESAWRAYRPLVPGRDLNQDLMIEASLSDNHKRTDHRPSHLRSESKQKEDHKGVVYDSISGILSRQSTPRPNLEPPLGRFAIYPDPQHDSHVTTLQNPKALQSI
jgi:hypothetical protein